MDFERLYSARFSGLHRRRNEIWRILCRRFFQKFVSPEASVLDLGCGYCEFINHIECAHKYAADINIRSADFAAKNITFLHCPADNISSMADSQLDVVFMSNLLEHLQTKDIAFRVLLECHRVLKPGGRLLILQPNIRYVGFRYWDFWDHHLPITDSSLCEALRVAGFQVEVLLRRFLPYTTKSRLSWAPCLVKVYVMFPLFWRIFGKQTFVAASCLKER